MGAMKGHMHGAQEDDQAFADQDGRGPSRSQKKRDSSALQQRGAELGALGPGIWATLPLPSELVRALEAARVMQTREAKRRQMQYIGRLMRELDAEALSATLDALDQTHRTSREAADALHRVEALRDALLHPEPETREQALAKALADCPGLDAGKLRHLVEAAAAERAKKRPPKQGRALFRYLRDCLRPPAG